MAADALGEALSPSKVDAHVAALGPAELLEGLPESDRAHLSLGIALLVHHEHADPPHALGLLRACGEPQCSRADTRYELAPFHLLELHLLPSPSAPAYRIGGVRSGARCSAEFTAGFCPQRVIHVALVASVNRPHVRFASESDRIAAQQRLTLSADIVAKVRNCPALIFLL